MVKTLKNVFSSFVALVTIMSSVTLGSFGFANVASAAAMAGDLIKASGPAVYYYAADGKRYVFPNEKTYFSWYVDFSSVKTITDSELASYQIGGNVTMRAGTKLVKITTDPKAYAVTAGGVLHWVQSEAIAQQLYGNNWAQRIVDVPDGFFVNYTVGSPVASAVHPDGQVVQYANDSNYYVVWNGQKRKFANAAALSANNINPAYAVMTTVSYPSGTDVTGMEADLATTVKTSGSQPVGGNLTVTLASDTPAGMTVPRNSSSVKLAKFDLTAGSGAVTVTGLTIHRVGVGAASDLANVYLYDQNGTRLTTGRTINGTTHTATFSSLNITVAAGSKQSVYVYGDFNVAASATGGQHSFEVSDAGSVTVSAGTVGGSFPVRANVFTVGTSQAGRLDVQKGATPANPTIGSKDVEVSNFKLIANTNDIKINSVTLYQSGSITNSDLTNFKLYQGNTVVGTAAGVTNDGHIVVNFSTPYLLPNGTTQVFSLHADVGGRAGRTITTYVEYTTDVNATDQVYLAGPAVCIAATATGGCSAVSQGSFDGSSGNTISVTTQGGTLTNAYNGPATSNVAKGMLAVPFYNFSLTSADNDLEIRNLRFSIDKAAGSGCLVVGSSSTKYFRSIKVKNVDTGVTVMGPTDITATTTSQTSSGSITLSDSFVLSAGKTLNLAIVADLSSSEDVTNEFFSNGSCSYKVNFQAFQSNDIRVVQTGEYLDLAKVIPNSAVAGNAQTVKSSSLSIALAGSPSSGTVVKKQQKVPVAGLVLSAGAQSDVLVTSLTLTCQAALATTGVAFGSGTLGTGGSNTALGNCATRVTSLSLWNGATQVGVAKAPDTSTGAAQITNMNLKVPAGTSLTLTAQADLSSTASSTSPYDQVAVGIGAAADVTAQDNNANTITPTLTAGVTGNANGSSPSVKLTILANGTLTVANDANPNSTIVVAGKDVWVPFAQYKASAQYESIKLDRIAVYASSTNGSSAADASDFTMVAIAQDGAVKASDVFGSGATGTKDLDLSGNVITVAKDGSVNFQVWAKLSNIQSSSSVSGATSGVHRSGNVPAIGLTAGLTTGEWDSNYGQKLNIRATGIASGERIYTASSTAAHGNLMVTRKSVPTVTKQALSSGTLANIDQDLIKFQVAADAAGSIAVKQIMFSISKTSGLTLSNFRVRKGASDMSLSDYAVTYASTTANNATADASSDVQSGSLSTVQNAGYVIVSFTNEETVMGSGNVYTLHASVSGAVSGQNVSVSFVRDSSNTIVTGYLISGAFFGGVATGTNVYHIDTATAPDVNATFGNVNATGTFLWSDGSELPHSSAVGRSGGSRDWSNDVYIQDLSQTQTLSL